MKSDFSPDLTYFLIPTLGAQPIIGGGGGVQPNIGGLGPSQRDMKLRPWCLHTNHDEQDRAGPFILYFHIIVVCICVCVCVFVCV